MPSAPSEIFDLQLYRLRKNSMFRVKVGGKHPSGAKARVDFFGFVRGLKPPPPSGSSFSAACVVLSRLTFFGARHGLNLTRRPSKR